MHLVSGTHLSSRTHRTGLHLAVRGPVAGEVVEFAQLGRRLGHRHLGRGRRDEKHNHKQAGEGHNGTSHSLITPWQIDFSFGGGALSGRNSMSASYTCQSVALVPEWFSHTLCDLHHSVAACRFSRMVVS